MLVRYYDIVEVKVWFRTDRVPKESDSSTNCFFFVLVGKIYMYSKKKRNDMYCIGNWIEAHCKPNTRRLGIISPHDVGCISDETKRSSFFYIQRMKGIAGDFSLQHQQL